MEIREITRSDELADVNDLAGLIWRTDGATVVPRELLRVLAATGSYVAGAFDGDTLVGFAVGVLARHHGELQLHSHIAGVHPKVQGVGTGFALKVHQRSWALAQGIDVITWTFDPLVRRNAVFNLAKLGATAADYAVDFYGDMSDGLNAGQRSDRWWVSWSLRDPSVIAAIEGAPRFIDPGEARVVVDDEGAMTAEIDGPALLFATPEDIERLRADDARSAATWSHALRTGLRDAVGRGYRVAGVDRMGRYVLRR